MSNSNSMDPYNYWVSLVEEISVYIMSLTVTIWPFQTRSRRHSAQPSNQNTHHPIIKQMYISDYKLIVGAAALCK